MNPGAVAGSDRSPAAEAFRETANFRVQMTLAFHKVAEEEGLTVSEEEYQEQLQSLLISTVMKIRRISRQSTAEI